MSCVHFLIYPEKLSSNVTSREKPSLTPANSSSVLRRRESSGVELCVWLSCVPPPAPGFLQAGCLPCIYVSALGTPVSGTGKFWVK